MHAAQQLPGCMQAARVHAGCHCGAPGAAAGARLHPQGQCCAAQALQVALQGLHCHGAHALAQEHARVAQLVLPAAQARTCQQPGPAAHAGAHVLALHIPQRSARALGAQGSRNGAPCAQQTLLARRWSGSWGMGRASLRGAEAAGGQAASPDQGHTCPWCQRRRPRRPGACG